MAASPPVPPRAVVEEVQALQALYGQRAVRLHGPPGSRPPPAEAAGAVQLEIDVAPTGAGAEASGAVRVTLLATLPAVYPAGAAPRLEVHRSRGLLDGALEALLKEAEAAVEAHGGQRRGCLSRVAAAVTCALAASSSECCICLEVCRAAEAVKALCGDVFHDRCLREWAKLKKKERAAKADEATAALSRQRAALERQEVEAEEKEEEAGREARRQEFAVRAAADWLEQMQRRACEAAASEQGEGAREAPEGGGESGGSSGSDEGGREGRHSKIKFNNTGWGEGKKKHFQPSSTRNKRRAKKYLKQVEEKVEEARQVELEERVRESTLAWEKAARELREARLSLERAQAQERHAQAKGREIRASCVGLGQDVEARKRDIIDAAIPCPVCTNPLNPDGVMPEAAKLEEAGLSPEGALEEEWLRRSSEAAAGRVDVRLVANKEAACPRDISKIVGVYLRDAAPADGLAEDRPTYSGPRGHRLHFAANEGGWLVTLGRLHKAFLEDTALTPDYAAAGSTWRVATAGGWVDARDLGAQCVCGAATGTVARPAADLTADLGAATGPATGPGAGAAVAAASAEATGAADVTDFGPPAAATPEGVQTPDAAPAAATAFAAPRCASAPAAAAAAAARAEGAAGKEAEGGADGDPEAVPPRAALPEEREFAPAALARRRRRCMGFSAAALLRLVSEMVESHEEFRRGDDEDDELVRTLCKLLDSSTGEAAARRALLTALRQALRPAPPAAPRAAVP